MRLLTSFGILLTLGMTAAAVWQITESPSAFDDIEPTARASPAPGEPVRVSVQDGQSPLEIGEALQSAMVIDSAVRFRILVSLLGYDRMLQAGEYEFDPNTPALEVVYRMRRGIISPQFVTVVEGWRLEQIADAVDAQGQISREEFLQAADLSLYDFDFLAGLPEGAGLEGYLFPTTYYFGQTDSARDLVSQMLTTFDERLTPDLRAEADEAGLSLHTVLTIASIVEREARLPEERPTIAQVFLTRLRRGIPLEADPTVQYALAADPATVEQFGYWKQELTEADLALDSPYNTYRATGLPPGPIASPGLEAITAVIRPDTTSFLYFVAKPDGSHAFAETLEEHLENVEKYRGQ